jgi:ferredoxin
MHGGSKQLQGDGSGKTIKVTFIEKDGEEVTVDAPTGSSMLEVAHANDVELEGACEGSLACSTCHVIVEDESLFERMGEISDDENDMLDTAFGLTETSRLGCQITASSDLHGMRLRLPLATKNFAKH